MKGIERTKEKMIGVAILGLLVALMAFSLSVIKKINMSIALPICFNGIMLILYLFGLFNCLLIGVYISVALPFLLFGLALLKKKKTILINLLCIRPIIFIWLLFIIFVIIIFNNRFIWMGDDLNHWALVAKNMYYNNRFCVGDNIYIYFTTYSEFSALPSYFALKLNGFFDEGALYATKILWGMILLFPFFIILK